MSELQTRWHFYDLIRPFTGTDLPEASAHEMSTNLDITRLQPVALHRCDFQPKWLVFALTSNAHEMPWPLFGSCGRDGDLSPRDNPCSFLCRNAQCPSWRAVSGWSRQWAFLSHLWPQKSCVRVPLWRTSLWCSPSLGLISSLFLDATAWSKGDSLPLTLVALAGCTAFSWNVPSFLAALSFFFFFLTV